LNLKKGLRKNEFTLEDFRDQMVQIRKMGSISELINMIPGMGKIKQLKNLEVDENEFIKIEAMINSMTPQERRQHTLIKGSRRKRIAKGSGTSVQDINNLLKNYTQVVKMMKKSPRAECEDWAGECCPFEGDRICQLKSDWPDTEQRKDLFIELSLRIVNHLGTANSLKM